VRKLAGEIEGMYPGSIMMLQEKMAFARRTALFSVSDLYCNASMRHGLSLVPFEYVLACSQLAPKDKKGGSLVISELAACSRVIPGTMKVNPSREEDFARAIDKCLVQPVLEKSHWREQQERWCRHNTVQLWAETIIVDMQRIAVSNVMSGGDTLRSSACRVGLTKSTYKEVGHVHFFVVWESVTRFTDSHADATDALADGSDFFSLADIGAHAQARDCVQCLLPPAKSPEAHPDRR